MAVKPAHCEAELVLIPVTTCDKPMTIYFKLSKPFVPQMVGPPLPGHMEIDACADHASQISLALTKGGHGPRWTQP